VEGQPFFTTIAGLAVSLAGFGAVIAWLRDDPSGWDPVNLWRVKTIVRHALTIAFLCLTLVPIHTFTQDDPITIRIGSALVALFALSDIWRVRQPDPVVWDPISWRVFVVTSGLLGLLGGQPRLGQPGPAPGARPRPPHLARRDLHQLRQGDGTRYRVCA
jgi:hypothetical protein